MNKAAETERYVGYIGNKHQHEDIYEKVRENRPDNESGGFFQHRLHDENTQAERRREKADGQIDGEDNAHVNGINAESETGGQQQRGEDQYRRARVEEEADEEQQNIQEKQE